MPTADQKDFIVDNGLDANESIKIGTQTVTSLVDSAQVSTIAREPANASAIALAGGASSKAYDSAELLPTSGNDSGDFGYVASTNRLYLWNGSGWYNIALVNTSPTISTSPDSNYTIDGGGGTAVTVTMLAVDPEGQSITYTQTSDSASNFVNITQDSGVFTLTPLTKAQADSNGVGSGGTFSITFRATDGVNIVPRVSSFTITWIVEYNWLEATEQASFKAGDIQSSQLFGSDVSLDQTGSTAAIGARNHDNAKGVGYIFDRVNSTWSQTAKLQITLSNRNSYQQAQFGYSAAISGNGIYAVFGAPYALYGSNYGKAFVFKKSSGTWAELSGGQLEAQSSANRANDDWVGSDVDIDKTGTRIIVGASRANHPSRSDAGGAYIWTNNGSDTFSYETFLQDVDAASKGTAQAGDSVAISNDGSVAIVGAADYNGIKGTRCGAALIYTRSGTSWTQIANLEAQNDGAGDDRFGYGVDISGDGNTAVAGAWKHHANSLSDAGAAYVYTKTTNYAGPNIAYDSVESPVLTSNSNLGSISEGSWISMVFNPDGTKLYALGYSTDKIYQFALSTAYDISSSSISYVGTHSSSLNTLASNSTPRDMKLNNDGTKVFVTDSGTSRVYEYDLSTAYDITTLSYNNVNKHHVTNGGDGGYGLEFNNDGTKMIIWSSGWGGTLEYDLSTPFSLATASSNPSQRVQFSGYKLYGMKFNPDGTKLFSINDDDNKIYQWNLTTPYDTSTMYQEKRKNMRFGFLISSQDTSVQGVELNGDGTKMYVIGFQNDKIYQYDISGVIYDEKQKLTAPTPAANLAFGESVSIDDRGTKIIVGERYYNSQQGRAHVYRKVGSTWYFTKTIYASNPTTDDGYGEHVSLSGDGNKAIIGSKQEDTTNGDSGMAYVWTAPAIAAGATITQFNGSQVKVRPTANNNQYDNFGDSLDISKDGNYIIVGARNADNGGRSYIFKLTAGSWGQVDNSVVSGGSLTGYSVAIDGDGDTVLIGSPNAAAGGSNRGAVLVKTRSGNNWSNEATLEADNKGDNDWFGGSVAISDDGNTAVVGAYYEDTGGSGAGSAYVFTRSGTTWTQKARFQGSDTAGGDEFGYVAISGDGSYILVGAGSKAYGGMTPAVGKAYVFTFDGTNVTQQAILVASDAVANNKFGRAVAIDGDGDTIAIGGQGGTSVSGTSSVSTEGAAYIFTRTGTTWTQRQILQASDARTQGWFSTRVGNGNGAIDLSYDGQMLVVGSWGEYSSNTGAVYGFTRSGNTFGNEVKMVANDAASADRNGWDAKIAGDTGTIVNGAPQDDTGGTNAGSIYVHNSVIESY